MYILHIYMYNNFHHLQNDIGNNYDLTDITDIYPSQWLYNAYVSFQLMLPSSAFPRDTLSGVL